MAMKTKIRLSMAAAVVSTLLLQACVTQLASEASNVRVITDPKEYNCEFRGVVTGSASMGWTTAHDAEGAFNDIMNKAAKKGIGWWRTLY